MHNLSLFVRVLCVCMSLSVIVRTWRLFSPSTIYIRALGTKLRSPGFIRHGQQVPLPDNLPHVPYNFSSALLSSAITDVSPYVWLWRRLHREKLL